MTTQLERFAREIITSELLNSLVQTMHDAARKGNMQRASDAAVTIGVLLAWMEERKLTPTINPPKEQP